MSAQTIKRDAVHGFLRGLNGKFFTVVFTKRTTGEQRTMTATTNYNKFLAGGDLKYDATAKSLIPVIDMALVAKGDPKPFRSIPTDAVLRITALGSTYEVVE